MASGGVFAQTGATDTPEVPVIQPNELKCTSQIGEGCFGVVWKGLCRGQEVAIKKLHVKEFEEDSLDEFKKEVAILSHLRHPNIIQLLGACITPGHLSIVTEYCDAGDLSGLMQRVKLTFVQKCQMLRDISTAMTWLHESHPPVIHRDLKPSNLLVDRDFKIKLCDFGLSAFQWTSKIQDKETAPGTPLWMAPEVLMGKPLSEKADLYSFGIVAWELFTGREPYEQHDNYEVFVNAVCLKHERPVLDKSIPKGIRDIIDSTWVPEPSKRPAMKDLIPRIDQALVEGSLSCPIAAHMWYQNWAGKTEVQFSFFAETLFKQLGVPRELTHIRYRALERLLSEKHELMQHNIVKIERFGLVLNWMGGLNAQRRAPFLERIPQLFSQKYFYGPIEKGPCEAALQRERKKGAFMVRFSNTEPAKTPFTISKLSDVKKGLVSHQRIYFTKTDGYFVFIKTKKEEKKVCVKGELNELILKVKKELELGNGDTGPTPYADLFLPSVPGSGMYTGDCGNDIPDVDSEDF